MLLLKQTPCFKEEEVRAAIEANPLFELEEITYEGDWVSITARKRSV